ncbi:MAG: hypothetical protein ACUVRG_07135 [Ignavibacterium sp.]|uniref:hypothetical protein n=1 Tax=Ignavibacterium sp. TaxID=2651167 RepID=UPI00404B99F5
MKGFALFILFVLTLMFAANTISYAQSQPVLYFCEKYDSKKGEVGISDRFTIGSPTIMVKCDYPLNLTDCAIQYDKYNERTGKFEYYKKFYFTIKPDAKYVYFTKNEENDMRFDDPGFYRVFLLDENDRAVTSSLIEIIQ